MGHGVDRRGGRWNCGLVVTVIDMGLGCGFVIWNSDQQVVLFFIFVFDGGGW